MVNVTLDVILNVVPQMELIHSYYIAENDLIIQNNRKVIKKLIEKKYIILRNIPFKKNNNYVIIRNVWLFESLYIFG